MDLDKAKIRALALSSGSAKAILDILASRDRIRKQTDVRRFYDRLLHDKATDLPPETFFETFKALEKLGVGKFIDHHRFKWNFSLRSVGEAAREDVRPSQTLQNAPERVIAVLFEDGRKVEIKIPQSLSEAERKQVLGIVTASLT